MSRTLTSVRERHKPQELGTRSTHGSSEFGFDPHPPINPYYQSQFAVDSERINESDAVAQRLQADVTLTSSATWYDILRVSLAGGLWILLGSGQLPGAGGVGDWRLWDGVNELARSGQGSGDATVPVFALVTPRTETTYVLQARNSAAGAVAVAQVCSLIAIRAFV